MKGAQHQSSHCTKLLVCGLSGTGKTGALAALAAEGYKLRVMDFDNGLDILIDYLTNPKSPYYIKNPHAIDNLEYLQFWSKAKNASGKLIPKPEAWQYAMQAMENWQDWETVEEAGPTPTSPRKVTRRAVEGSSLGPVASWGSDVVLVVDSFSGMSDAAMEFMLQVNARIGQGIRESDWGDAQQLLWEYLEQISSPEIKCNVILNCHIKDVSKENEPVQLMPNTLGKKLPKDLPTKFNTILELKKDVKEGKMKFYTKPAAGTGVLPVKTSAPLRVAESYPIEWGLVEYFKAARTRG